MSRMIKKIGILFFIFAAALLLLFLTNKRLNRREQTVYSVMNEAVLPVVTVEMFGKNMNRMVGYRQEMNNLAAGSCLTILPQDRALSVNVGGGSVTGISYEVRSMDRERLVERTKVDEWEQTESGIRVILPIQNLLMKEREYLMRLQIDTEQYGPVYYYTRILWTDDSTVQSMIELATDFSARTFDYEQARELTTYLETDAMEDNGSFGCTSIRSSFSQLTWGDLEMKPVGEVQVTLQELDGIMCGVQLFYLCTRETENGAEFYEVEENFTMKWNEIRTYLMDYERYVNQIFQGNNNDYMGKRIMLGITNDDRVEVKCSDENRVFAYRVNRDLWSYMPQERKAVKVFSFRGSEITDVRSNYNRHDLRILAVDDSGDVEFLLFGYMNRGNHEGQMGIAGYHYDSSENVLDELYFIPYAGSYEALEKDLDQLIYRSSGEMLYLYVNHAVFGIDLKSREHMVVADALVEGNYAVSADQRRIAWQEGGKLYESQTLHVMDLETGEKWEIQGDEQEYVRTLGFVGRDLVYGIAKKDDTWIINGRVEGLPMYSVKIMNDRMEEETSYQESGYYISGVKVEDSRLHLSRVSQVSDHHYVSAQQDTIVCNADMGPSKMDGIGWYASQDKGKLYFVQLVNDARSGKNVRVLSPKRVGVEQSDFLELKSNYQVQGMHFHAYGGGHLRKITMDFAEAVQIAHEKMGFVTDENRQILWNRVNRGNVKHIKEPVAAFSPVQRHLENFSSSRSYSDGVVILDGRSCSMMQMLYFIDGGIPVMAYTTEGEYLLLCGFDQYNVTVYDPVTGETYKAGLNDSTALFESYGNDFVCGIQLQ